MNKRNRFVMLGLAMIMSAVMTGLVIFGVYAIIGDSNVQGFLPTKAGTQHVEVSPFTGITPTSVKSLSFDDQMYKYSAPVRIYYADKQYQLGRHRIIKIWTKYTGQLPPEALSDTAINIPYSVIEVDTEYSPYLKDIMQWATDGKYYVDSKAEIIQDMAWTPPLPPIFGEMP